MIIKWVCVVTFLGTALKSMSSLIIFALLLFTLSVGHKSDSSTGVARWAATGDRVMAALKALPVHGFECFGR